MAPARLKLVQAFVRRRNTEAEPGIAFRRTNELIQPLHAALPFELTGAQATVETLEGLREGRIPIVEGEGPPGRAYLGSPDASATNMSNAPSLSTKNTQSASASQPVVCR